MASPLKLVLCFALVVARVWGTSIPPTGTSEPPDVQTVAPTEEDDTLQNEADNQENVLSQLLGDYDKVKAVSEGSDCQCKCVVRPLGRDACQRINSGASRKEDVYTVETITSGSSCKCACVAPPSAVNPCEGDFRLQKLREADSRDLKLSTIIDMLEGAFYGLDLLKLHSVTTKLVGRVDKLEEEVSKNLTKENEQIKEDVQEIRTEMSKRGKENCSDTILDSMPDIRSALQRDAAAAYAHPEYEERFLQEETVSQQINSIELLRTQPLVPPAAMKPQQPLQRRVYLRGRVASKPTVIRGITYYKAKISEEENDIEEQHDELFSGDNGVDLLIEDQLLRHEDLLTSATRRPATTRHGAAVTTDASVQAISLSSAQASTSTASIVGPDSQASTGQLLATTQSTTEFPEPTGAMPSTQVPPTTVAHTAIQPPPASVAPAIVPEDIFVEAPHLVPVLPDTAGTDMPEEEGTAGQEATSAGPILSPEEEDDIRNVIGRCKDTLSTITGPTTQNTYGRNEGAWMKDPLAKDDRIYVTNYYYGNTLVEFRNLENFKQGRWSNSYKLPYSWIGTGHVVYNGAFYYNRAFTRNIIKYDLKQRYVAAWAMLHDVAYEEATPWRWQGHSDVDFAVDENGLWLIYPALDDEGFSQEVIVLSKLNAVDLSTQKETTWRTGLRRNFYGNCFVICGVLYAVDSYNQRNANISYAFDTHTNTQIVPRLLFENEYSYTTQIDYNPKDRLLYAWDNGHQVTYHVIFAY
ncbi:olfactomedin-like protein 2B isoform X2 [Cricetulus griseus]|uniref:Olfactomedin-like 2B n=1 Tax=Cricetulus griseus TaxID=10029 RepID=G3HU02_CRIGR|nr:olfactomedin-like protein 2B isoform X2 [Cricetulus griseus]XP_027272862.1 olfactomedin-like protein 2B isoform X2 [Cricetulus griseus]EGW08580.1 Olfactomedin-like protein 2B [Cricetulus griseus]ERE73185.1 olfactomedin-like protein 2B [Cricetulus griseus]